MNKNSKVEKDVMISYVVYYRHAADYTSINPKSSLILIEQKMRSILSLLLLTILSSCSPSGYESSSYEVYDAYEENKLAVYDVKEKTIITFDYHIRERYADHKYIFFDNDNKLLLIDTENYVVFNLTTNTIEKELEHNLIRINSIKLSSDATTLQITSEDSSCSILDLSTFQTKTTFPTFPTVVTPEIMEVKTPVLSSSANNTKTLYIQNALKRIIWIYEQKLFSHNIETDSLTEVYSITYDNVQKEDYRDLYNGVIDSSWFQYVIDHNRHLITKAFFSNNDSIFHFIKEDGTDETDTIYQVNINSNQTVFHNTIDGEIISTPLINNEQFIIIKNEQNLSYYNVKENTISKNIEFNSSYIAASPNISLMIADSTLHTFEGKELDYGPDYQTIWLFNTDIDTYTEIDNGRYPILSADENKIAYLKSFFNLQTESRGGY